MAFAWTHTSDRQTIAQVTDKTRKPEGVVSKRAQQYVILGTAVVIVLVAMFSSNRQHKPVSAAQSGFVPPVHETNEPKIADYGQELAEQQRRALSQLPPPSNPATPMHASESATAGEDRTGAGEWRRVDERDPLAQKERERAYSSRFSSNIAYAEQRTVSQSRDSSASDALPNANIAALSSPSTSKKPVNVNVNGATGQPYVLFEGTILETALVTRLDGDFSGPVKVMLTSPVFSRDRQHVLIPDGTNILGEVRQVQGFGQRRLAVVFHRLIMPDGYSMDLDQFHGLNQLGETGLKDQVNNHYIQIFGASIALGLIAGAAESSVPNVGINETGSEAYRVGVASSLSQSSTRVLERFLNVPPTLTIREGYRVKIYLTNDLLLPAYENHTIPPNI